MRPETKDVLPPRYADPELIAEGGMGEVYRASDVVLGRTVAVKVLAARYAADEELQARFTREGLAAAQLSAEPSVVTIFDVGEWEGRPFIVMEHLDGGSLEQRLRHEGAQQPARALAWLEQAGRALDAAHARGIVHRDVKPANLLLDRDDGLHVADFGIARAAGADSFTQPGTVLGTAGYLSPEQARGERATAASDRYALGVVAFELLTGTRPFQADTPTAEAAAHAHAAVPAASSRRPELPPELDGVLRCALAKDPAARFPSCDELAAAVRGAFERDAATTVAFATARPRSHRSWAVPAIAVTTAALAGAGVAALLVARGTDPASPPRTLVRTVVSTAPGTTLQVTVTGEAPTEPAPDGDLSTGISLTDEATGLMRDGRFAEALPVALRAYEILAGSGHLYEAYAAFDVGATLARLGRCEDALRYLDRSERLQGERGAIKAARKGCDDRGRGRDRRDGDDD